MKDRFNFKKKRKKWICLFIFPKEKKKNAIDDVMSCHFVCLLMFECRRRRWPNFMANGSRIEHQQITSEKLERRREEITKEKRRRKELDRVYHEPHNTRQEIKGSTILGVIE